MTRISVAGLMKLLPVNITYLVQEIHVKEWIVRHLNVTRNVKEVRIFSFNPTLISFHPFASTVEHRLPQEVSTQVLCFCNPFPREVCFMLSVYLVGGLP